MPNNLKKIRLLKGYSLRKMAEILGISSTSLMNIENGKTKLSEERIKEFIKHYGCSKEQILGQEDMGINQGYTSKIEYVPEYLEYSIKIMHRMYDNVGEMGESDSAKILNDIYKVVHEISLNKITLENIERKELIYKKKLDITSIIKDLVKEKSINISNNENDKKYQCKN